MKTTHRRTRYLTVLASSALLALSLVGLACGTDIGARCDEPGSLDECEDGGICTNESNGVSTCRLLCQDHVNCPPGFQCNGVTNTNHKSCQPS